MTRDSVRRALRTFVITTLGLFLPGLTGWLNALTQWALDEGQRPLPDGHGLVYLGVSAVAAGFVAVVNLIWNAVEDATGKGMLRAVPPTPQRGQGGWIAPPLTPLRGASRDRSLPGKERIRARRASHRRAY